MLKNTVVSVLCACFPLFVWSSSVAAQSGYEVDGVNTLDALAECLDRNLTDQGIEKVLGYAFEYQMLGWQAHQDELKSQGKRMCNEVKEPSLTGYNPHCYYGRVPSFMARTYPRDPNDPHELKDMDLVVEAARRCKGPALLAIYRFQAPLYLVLQRAKKLPHFAPIVTRMTEQAKPLVEAVKANALAADAKKQAAEDAKKAAEDAEIRKYLK
jgi:hypothetical protein